MFMCTICAQIVNHTFVHKRLMNIILDLSLLSVCAQMVDRYIGTKRKSKFNENQENNTLGKCKQLPKEKVKHWSDTLDSKRTENGCPMFQCTNGCVSRFISVCCPNIGRPFAVHLLSVCCPKRFAV